ncbi:MAG: hypothetical protein U1C58_00075 [Flavobacteriaceae bacterium]|nr:hypothetical protein [Flavobacteriaceae bacterium]MDZ4146656.1 hypothetical protein [Flavobacteriaceae bacterium]
MTYFYAIAIPYELMKQIIILMVLIGISSNVFCQTEQIRITTLADSIKKNSGASKLQFTTNMNEAREYALVDIENKTPFLITKGGIAPSISIDQINFEEKYPVYFYRPGNSFLKKDVEGAYNFVVLDFILRKYGKAALAKISKDVFAFDDWKKQN